MTAHFKTFGRVSLFGAALAAATWMLLTMTSACSSTGYTVPSKCGKLPLYDVRIDGAVPPARKTAASNGCVTLPGHATTEGGAE